MQNHQGVKELFKKEPPGGKGIVHPLPHQKKISDG